MAATDIEARARYLAKTLEPEPKFPEWISIRDPHSSMRLWKMRLILRWTGEGRQWMDDEVVDPAPIDGNFMLAVMRGMAQRGYDYILDSCVSAGCSSARFYECDESPDASGVIPIVHGEHECQISAVVITASDALGYGEER